MSIFFQCPSHNTGTTRKPHQVSRFLYFILDNNLWVSLRRHEVRCVARSSVSFILVLPTMELYTPMEALSFSRPPLPPFSFTFLCQWFRLARLSPSTDFSPRTPLTPSLLTNLFQCFGLFLKARVGFPLDRLSPSATRQISMENFSFPTPRDCADVLYYKLFVQVMGIVGEGSSGGLYYLFYDLGVVSGAG